METIGDRLKLYAKTRCGSMKRLAEELGMRPDNLQKYASDRHEPGARLLQELARHGCNVHWLITGDGVMIVEEIQREGVTKRGKEMLDILNFAGISDPITLKSIVTEIERITASQESLKRLVGKTILTPTDQQKKSSK